MSTHYIEEAERLCDSVTIMSHGKAVATGPPRELVAEHAGAEAVEVYGPPAKLAEVEREARAAGLKTRRTGTSVSVLGANGNAPEGERRPTNLEDVFVLLTGEEICMSAAHRPARAPRPDGRARARDHQLQLASGARARSARPSSRRSTCSRSASASARLVSSTVGGLDYVDYVGTGTVATAVLFSSAFPGMFGTFVKYKFQRTYDAILAAPVDTEELVTAEALWIAIRAGDYGCAPMLVAMLLRAGPELGHAARPVHRRSSPASAGRTSASPSPRG